MATIDDDINPQHYRGAGDLECIDVIDAFGLDFYRASCLKYLLRAGKKGDALVCLRKAKWFLDRYVSREEAKRQAETP